MTKRFKLSEVDLGDKFAVLVYDLVQRRLVYDICDYALELAAKLQLSRLTVVQETTHLRIFWSYLVNKELLAKDVTDAELTKFRDQAFCNAKRSPSHRGIDNSSRQTINAKLVRIYDWLLWLQEKGRIPANTIGPRDRSVSTSLVGSSLSVSREKHRRGSLPSTAYPLLFRVTTANTKHALPASIPTEETVDALHGYFFDKRSSAYLAHRDSLLVDVAAYTGFRRGSIQSLRTQQFIGSDFALTERDTVILKPGRQKFNYGNTFEIPLYLHEQIKAFIEEFLSSFIKNSGYPRTAHKDHLFISSRSGKPLTDGALTSIVSKAMRAKGLSKGTALHSFRAKFINEEIAEEYRHRQELELDTSTESINRAASSKLGHKNVDSVRAYTSKYESSKVMQRRAHERTKLQKAEERIAELEDQVKDLMSEKTTSHRRKIPTPAQVGTHRPRTPKNS